MEIDLKKLSDLPFSEVTDLWNLAFSDYLVPINMSQTQLADRFTHLGLSKSLSLVAVQGGELVGILLYGEQDYQGKKQGWIGGMAVIPGKRQLGIAQLLMTAALGQGRARGLDELLLEVISSNSKAIKLYEKIGFNSLTEVLNGHIDLKVVDPQKKPHLVLKSVPVTKQQQLLESPVVIWQNRLVTPGELALVTDGKDEIGFVFYSSIISEKRLVIKQVLVLQERQTFLEELLLSLRDYQDVEKITFSNLDLKDPINEQLSKQVLDRGVSQIQMIYRY
ncbi:GNAT family N-acetyltransferase [Vagococcus salmoninarum]|uniref:N-acetyltransferase domain-containing protein n=1 Tax=Vagococcus salmoninarum TaxID=2739 RepID=A0A429ZUW7_9ENTE|nr:GNAT family N-acetyltransferase [Vagococcus salmoninarum]RST97534.1 hypothetical protein CBF35_02380 [Vagococcus salmoninarum]